MSRRLFPANEDGIEVAELTREEGRELFDKAARRALGISGDEFLRRWDAGGYRECRDEAAFGVSMLIPFAR